MVELRSPKPLVGVRFPPLLFFHSAFPSHHSSLKMSGLFRELFRVNVHKPSQGKVARRLTGIAIAVVFFCGAYAFYYHVGGWLSPAVLGAMTMMIAAIGCWLAFRAINWAPFADFLVAVEAEMAKVSWPSSAETYSSTIVVLTLLGLLASVIFVFDLFWYFIFHFFFQII